MSRGGRYFGEQGVAYVVLEAGLGGRFDSTNFIENPLATVITSVSLDHQALLGNTVEEIAWHKAGDVASLTWLALCPSLRC
jgi:dihydrofolate synthase / folylpolyglutamate synthase